jgi:ankyrin repeat protein
VLILAAASGHTEVVDVLLSHGANPNAATETGSALMSAIEAQDEASVRLLLAAGADPNLQPSENLQSPLSRAEQLGGQEIARLVREAGGKA